MDLYLVRHGKALHPAEDPERGLTELGKQQAESTARWAASAGTCVRQIWHSGKRRAAQTADIFGRHLSPPLGITKTRGLAPNDNVTALASLLEAEAESVMIVGHLPFLPRLASALVSGDPDRVGFGMPETAVLCLAKREGRWFVRWMVTPEEVSEGK